jgi:hypothetical protein
MKIVVAIKCFTKVVDDGLNKCKYPDAEASFWSVDISF